MIVFSNEKNDLNSSKFQFKEPNLNYIHQSISAHNCGGRIYSVFTHVKSRNNVMRELPNKIRV